MQKLLNLLIWNQRNVVSKDTTLARFSINNQTLIYLASYDHNRKILTAFSLDELRYARTVLLQKKKLPYFSFILVCVLLAGTVEYRSNVTGSSAFKRKKLELLNRI